MAHRSAASGRRRPSLAPRQRTLAHLSRFEASRGSLASNESTSGTPRGGGTIPRGSGLGSVFLRDGIRGGTWLITWTSAGSTHWSPEPTAGSGGRRRCSWPGRAPPVHLGCRNPQRGAEAAERIAQRAPGAITEVLPLDLGRSGQRASGGRGLPHPRPAARPACQQRRGHGRTQRAHRGRVRDARRGRPPRALRPHRLAPPRAEPALRRSGGHGQQLVRPSGTVARGRSPWRTALRPLAGLRRSQAGQLVLRARAGPPATSRWIGAAQRGAPTPGSPTPSWSTTE